MNVSMYAPPPLVRLLGQHLLVSVIVNINDLLIVGVSYVLYAVSCSVYADVNRLKIVSHAVL